MININLYKEKLINKEHLIIIQFHLLSSLLSKHLAVSNGPSVASKKDKYANESMNQLIKNMNAKRK